MGFAPLILLGYMLTLQTSWHHTESVSSPVVEVQSCETGWGLDAKAATAGYYGLGTQYGWKWTFDTVSLGVIPKSGFSYVDHPAAALPMGGQFQVGGQVLVGYKRWRAGVEYWHLSNAGLEQPNVGMDFLLLQVGWMF